MPASPPEGARYQGRGHLRAGSRSAAALRLAAWHEPRRGVRPARTAWSGSLARRELIHSARRAENPRAHLLQPAGTVNPQPEGAASARRATRKRPPHYSQAPAAPPLNTRRRAASYPVITTIWSSRAADLADHMKYSEHCVRERVQGGFCACFLAVCGLAKAACRHWLAKWSGRSTARFEEARW